MFRIQLQAISRTKLHCSSHIMGRNNKSSRPYYTWLQRRLKSSSIANTTKKIESHIVYQHFDIVLVTSGNQQYNIPIIQTDIFKCF